jgi:hypothetical protein
MKYQLSQRNQIINVFKYSFTNYPFFSSQWNNFYSSSEGKRILEDNSHINYNNNQGNLYFTNLVFISISNPSQGGALFFSITSTNNVLIEKTMFTHCKTTTASQGGAIYFFNYGSLIFHQICSYDCTTGGTGTIYGQFCYCLTNSNNQYNLSLISSSIINSINNNGQRTIDLVYGTHLILKTNSSNHQSNYHTGLLLEYISVTY